MTREKVKQQARGGSVIALRIGNARTLSKPLCAPRRDTNFAPDKLNRQ